MIRPPIKNEAEEINLEQKKRLQYLLTRYAPRHLTGVELYRRLRLSDAYDPHDPDRDEQNSEKGYEKKVLAEKKRWLPDALALRTTNVGQLKQWMQLKGGANYRPNKGFDRRACEAFGFVIADEFEHWRGPLEDAEHEKAYRRIADFISSGSGQPAEIFYGIHSAFADEVTNENREQVATTEQCRRFLRGGIPSLSVVNAGATVRRDVESIDGRSLADFIKDDPRRMLLITSAAGDGKTTLLFRLARTFFDRGWCVFVKRTNSGFDRFDAPIGRAADTVLLIDRGEDIQDLDQIWRWLADNPRLHIVVVARDMEWQNRNFPTEDGRYRHLFIDRLSDREIDAEIQGGRRSRLTGGNQGPPCEERT